MFRSALVVALLAFQASAQAPSLSNLCRGYFPPNTLNIPTGFRALGAGGLSEAQFNDVLDRLQAIYTPIFAAKGARLEIGRLWSNGEVNAFADRVNNVWSINMFGGMARHPKNTEEGFAMVACHEIGHHIGGAPQYRGDWASNEGESDYYSTAKCLRFFYEHEDNEAWARTATIDPLAVQRCSSQFSDRNEALICMRATVGAQALAAIMSELDGSGKLAQLSTPDKKVVPRTSDMWPESQCRMDTVFSAATCTVDKTIELGEKDARIGACNQGVEPFGWRPNCWFRP